MKMMRFYDIVNTAGKNLLPFDALSRAPGGAPAEQDRQMEVEINMFVRSVIEGFPASDKRLEEIREKQNQDGICKQVINFCKMDNWPESARRDEELKQYWFIRHDLTVQQGLLLFQSRLVIPADLRDEMLERVHEGHQGIVKCLALARSSI